MSGEIRTILGVFLRYLRARLWGVEAPVTLWPEVGPDGADDPGGIPGPGGGSRARGVAGSRTHHGRALPANVVPLFNQDNE